MLYCAGCLNSKKGLLLMLTWLYMQMNLPCHWAKIAETQQKDTALKSLWVEATDAIKMSKEFTTA